jgi:hypothetical protein
MVAAHTPLLPMARRLRTNRVFVAAAAIDFNIRSLLFLNP